MRKYIFFISFLLICFTVYSQDENLQQTTLENTSNEWSDVDADSIFVIDTFFFNIDGKTRESALIRTAGLKKGQELIGVSSLENYIQEKTQLLFNQRVLENVFLDYSYDQKNNDGKYPLDVYVNVKDTNNFLIFPYPQYSTNYGFGLSLNFIHNNFLGTMSPFTTEVGYKYDEFGRHNYLFSLENTIPFRALEKNWSFIIFNEFLYRPYLDNPLFYMNTTGLSVDLPVNTLTITPSFNISTIINQEIISSGNSICSDSHVLIFSPKIEFKHIDWIGNFRKGYSISLIQSYYYYFYNKRNDNEPWGISNGIAGIIHQNFTSFFGISTRLMFRHWGLSAVNNYAGDVLRGILDNDVCADLMFSLNLDFPFKALSIKPSEWFKNKKLEFFNFDLHLVPVLDTAWYRHPSIEAENFYDNILISGGIEAIIYPQKFRSFCLRISFGKMIRGNVKTGSYELHIGGSLFY